MDRRLLFAVAALLLVVLLTLVLSEGLVRVAKRFVCYEQIASVYARNSVYGWGHEPGTESWEQGCRGSDQEFRVRVQINAKGLRDVEHTYAKPKGVRRVLIIGDSIVQATQVPLEQTLARRLQHRLDESETAIEVINAGTAGWGTDNELLFFREEGRRYQPEVVVLLFNLTNDVSDNSVALYRRTYREAGHEALGKAPASLDASGSLSFDFEALRRYIAEADAEEADKQRSLWFQLTKRFYVLRLVDQRFVNVKEPTPPLRGLPTLMEIYVAPPNAEWQHAWALTEALVRDFRRETARAGAKLLVALLPSSESVARSGVEPLVGGLPPGAQWSWDHPRERVRELLDRQSIAYVDLTETLRAQFQASGETGFFAFDPHLTAAGHELVARALQDRVAELLPNGPATGTQSD